MNTKRLSRLVTKKISQVKIDTANRTDYLSFFASPLPATDELVQAEQLKSMFIPAIVYWHWNTTIGCDINSRYLAGLFSNSIAMQAEKKELRAKLKGAKVEVFIEELPNRFVYVNKGYVIFLLVAYTLSGVEGFFPDTKQFSLKLSFRIMNDGVISSSNSVELKGVPTNVNKWSTQKFVDNYLDAYVVNIETLSAVVVDKIINTIEKANPIISI
jgi:hypothetical protein